jgi:hypothetical protein
MVDRKRIRLLSCAGVEYEPALLRHFLSHYLDLGILPSHVHLILNARVADSPRLAEAAACLRELGIGPAEIWIGPYTSGAMWEKRRLLQRRFVNTGDWVISADADELHEYPGTLPGFLSECEEHGINAVQGVFIDRLAPGGELRPVSGEPSLWHQFPIEADVACSIGGTGRHHNFAGTVKMMAFTDALEPSLGGHSVLAEGREEPRYWFGYDLGHLSFVRLPWFRSLLPLRVHHFKWSRDMRRSIQTRLRTPGASIAGSEYGRKLLEYCARHGRVRLEDAAIYRHRRLGRAGRRLAAWRPVIAAGLLAHAIRSGAALLVPGRPQQEPRR